MEDHGRRVGSVDLFDHAVGGAFGRGDGVRENRIEGELHVGGGERAAVVELHSGAEMKDVGERVGRFPALGEIATDVHLVVAFDQAAEKQAVDAFGEGVGADARVEIGGHGFD